MRQLSARVSPSSTCSSAVSQGSQDSMPSNVAPCERRSHCSRPQGSVPIRAAARSRTSAVGGSKGSAVRNSLEALTERGEIVRDPAHRSGYRVVDPLLALWVRQGRPAAVFPRGE